MINMTDGSNLHKDIIKKLAYTYTEANFNLYLKAKNKNMNLPFEFNKTDEEDLKQLNEFYISAYNYLINLYDSNYDPKIF